MKKLLTTFLTFISFTSFGQLIIYSSQDTTDRFTMETLRESGDSTFVTVSHFIKGKLIHREDQINIRMKANPVDGECKEGADSYVIKTIFHGNSIQWYINGQLKCKGSFYFDKENPDWKYWDTNGKEIPPPDIGADMNVRGHYVYYIDGVRVQDTIVVNIAHGSKPRKPFNDEFKTIGGMKGGHVVIQIDKFTYGFFFTGHRIHVFPHGKSKNGVFQKETLSEWTTITKDKKVTKVFIPVTNEEKLKLLAFYEENLKAPRYDYSFFGQRCASSAYNALKSINKIKGGNYFFNAFYPGRLRKNILKQSTLNGYRVTVKEGSKKRIWEGD